MKAFFLMTAVLLIGFAETATAEITFRCDAAAGDECAFSVIHPDGKGMTNFVLGSKQVHSVNDQFAGGRYCVVVSKPGAQVRDWPPKCVNAKDSSNGKIVEGIKAGGTYN